jgi:hypothetical protein
MMTGAVIHGSATTDFAGAKHTGNSTPANSALANGPGIIPIQRASGRHKPAMTVSTPATTNAPSAAR